MIPHTTEQSGDNSSPFKVSIIPLVENSIRIFPPSFIALIGSQAILKNDYTPSKQTPFANRLSKLPIEHKDTIFNVQNMFNIEDELLELFLDFITVTDLTTLAHKSLEDLSFLNIDLLGPEVQSVLLASAKADAFSKNPEIRPPYLTRLDENRAARPANLKAISTFLGGTLANECIQDPSKAVSRIDSIYKNLLKCYKNLNILKARKSSQPQKNYENSMKSAKESLAA